MLAGCGLSENGAETTEDTGAPGSAEPAAVVDLAPYVGRLRTASVVVGPDTVRLLFDTGGGQTLLAPERTGGVPCDDPSDIVASRMSGERVEWPTCGGATFTVGGLTFGDVRYGVWDVMGVLPAGLPPLDGVLSLDLFRGRAVTLDLAASRLVVESPRSLEHRIAGMREVPARIATGTSGELLSVFVRVDVDTAGTAWLLVDSANLDDVLLSDRRPVPADSLTLDLGGTPVRAAVRTASLVHDGALSEAVLAQLVVTFDLSRMRVWIAPS